MLLRVTNIERISTDSAGVQGNGFSGAPIFSPDGSKVAFVSAASNLVAGDTNGASDSFVKDLSTGAVTRISTDSAGAQGNSYSESPIFSPDGSKVAFVSGANNLVAGDTFLDDIFIKDLNTGAVTRISTNNAGEQGNWMSDNPVFSPDGSKVAFVSGANNLVAGDTNGTWDVFVKDLATGVVTCISTNSTGVHGNAETRQAPVFSPDGTKVAFYSTASNLVADDTNGTWDVFVKDLSTGAVTRISTDSAGVQGNNSSGGPVFSPDGNKVTFSSSASNLVADDTNGRGDVFVVTLVEDKLFMGSNTVHDLYIGGAGNDTISGLKGNDTLEGGGGNDSINGGFNNDLLRGGEGNDTVLGGDQDDVLYGDAGDDLLNGQGAKDLLFGGEGNDTVLGEGFDDTLWGGTGNDSVDGGQQNDLLYGEDGTDTLLGANGNDTVFGGADGDSINAGAGADSVDGGQAMIRFLAALAWIHCSAMRGMIASVARMMLTVLQVARV